MRIHVHGKVISSHRSKMNISGPYSGTSNATCTYSLNLQLKKTAQSNLQIVVPDNWPQFPKLVSFSTIQADSYRSLVRIPEVTGRSSAQAMQK